MKIQSIQNYNRDIYALGVTLLGVYRYKNEKYGVHELVRTKEIWERVEKLDRSVFEILTKILDPDPRRRFDSIEIEDYLYFDLQVNPSTYIGFDFRGETELYQT